MVDLSTLLDQAKLDSERVRAVYLYGSHAYGNAHSGSDQDFLVVTEDDGRKWRTMRWLHRDGWLEPEKGRYRGARRDFIGRKAWQIWMYTPDTFQMLIDAHAMKALECLWLPEPCRWKETRSFSFALDLTQLRRQVRFTAARHREKGLRMLDRPKRDETPYMAKKQLHHALRFWIFGAQLAQHARIVDYTAANPLRTALMDAPEDAVRAWFDEADAHHEREFTDALRRAGAPTPT